MGLSAGAWILARASCTRQWRSVGLPGPTGPWVGSAAPTAATPIAGARGWPGLGRRCRNPDLHRCHDAGTRRAEPHRPARGGAILAPIVAAVVVAVWVQRLGGLHGLCAAFVAGCITALLPALWAKEAIGLVFLGHVNRGGMLVLFIAPGCAALARTVRRALGSTARSDRHRTAAHLGRSIRLR